MVFKTPLRNENTFDKQKETQETKNKNKSLQLLVQKEVKCLCTLQILPAKAMGLRIFFLFLTRPIYPQYCEHRFVGVGWEWVGWGRPPALHTGSRVIAA